MVEHGIIRWLARQLSHADTLPLSSLECYGALLMNLAMCKPGREECQQVHQLHLTCLSVNPTAIQALLIV